MAEFGELGEEFFSGALIDGLCGRGGAGGQIVVIAGGPEGGGGVEDDDLARRSGAARQHGLNHGSTLVGIIHGE